MTFLHDEKFTTFLFDSSMCWSDSSVPSNQEDRRSTKSNTDQQCDIPHVILAACPHKQQLPNEKTVVGRKDQGLIESVMKNTRSRNIQSRNSLQIHVSPRPKLGHNLPQPKAKAVHASVTRWICRRFGDLQSTAAASFCIFWLDLEEARSVIIIYICNV